MTLTPHLNAMTYTCPCGGTAVGSFVLPKQPHFLVVVGTCASCFMRRKNPTTTATFTITRKEWLDIARDSRFIMEADNG